MQEGTNRVLAYTLATPLPDQDLDQVSGGYAEASTHQSVKATQGNSQCPDVQYDVSRDFDL